MQNNIRGARAVIRIYWIAIISMIALFVASIIVAVMIMYMELDSEGMFNIYISSSIFSIEIILYLASSIPLIFTLFAIKRLEKLYQLEFNVSIVFAMLGLLIRGATLIAAQIFTLPSVLSTIILPTIVIAFDVLYNYYFFVSLEKICLSMDDMQLAKRVQSCKLFIIIGLSLFALTPYIAFLSNYVVIITAAGNLYSLYVYRKLYLKMISYPEEIDVSNV